MVMADLKRYFVGSLHRGKDEDGNGFVSGKVTVNEGVMIGRAENEQKMGNWGKTSMILGTKYNHN
jgi:hypothetical protein